MSGDVVVPRRTVKSIGTVEGDLIIERATVQAIQPPIIVKGAVRCRGDCRIEDSIIAHSLKNPDGDVDVHGDLQVENLVDIHGGNLNVRGNLSAKSVEAYKKANIKGSLAVDDIKVSRSLYVRGTSKAETMRVGNKCELEASAEITDLKVGNSLNTSGYYIGKIISIGGNFKAKENVDVENIDVGGNIHVDENLISKYIRVGGNLYLQGGKLGGQVITGGKIRSRDFLMFEDLRAASSIEIESGEGRNIDVGGSFKCHGDLKFNEMDVGGRVKIDGNAEGSDIDVGGTVKIGGNLQLTNSINVGGILDVKQKLTASSVEVSGKITCYQIEARDNIETNLLRTTLGAKANRIKIGKNGEVEGPIIAKNVYLKEKVNAEDIYGEDVTLRRGCIVNNIYAARVIIDSNCQILGKILYTESLSLGKRVDYRSNPEKIEILPEPPF